MVLRERIELSTSPLPRECSTTELPQLPPEQISMFRNAGVCRTVHANPKRQQNQKVHSRLSKPCVPPLCAIFNGRTRTRFPYAQLLADNLNLPIHAISAD